jgi:hypothetical protein
MTKRSKRYNELRQFTGVVKKELKSKIYSKLFKNIKRISDRARFKNNDQIALIVTLDGVELKIAEKFGWDTLKTELTFDLFHTDRHGKLAEGNGLKAKDADIFVYTKSVYPSGELREVYFLRPQVLVDISRPYFQKLKANDCKNIAGDPIKYTKGERLQNGKFYQAIDFVFQLDELPDEAFFFGREESIWRF